MTGKDFKALRDQRGWSQQELADFLNGSLDRKYSSATVSQWELGKRPVPKPVATFLQELALVDVLPPDSAFTDPPPAAASPGDPPAADAPPGAPTPSTAVMPHGGTGVYARVCTELWEMIATGIGVFGAAVGNPRLVRDGLLIDADKIALGRAYGRLAESNETFRKMLLGATSSGAWVEVALITGGTAAKLWRNHLTVYPGEAFGAAAGEPDAALA